MISPQPGLVAFALLLAVVATAAPDPALLKKAQAGDAEAELEVFQVLANEAETAEARAEAEQYLRRAANRGYARAQHILAWHLSEKEGTPENLAEAAGWWRKAADQNIGDAQQKFGFLVAQGLGTKRDLPTAVRYLKLAGAQGSHDALSYLVKLFSEGEDFFGNKQPVDLKEAIQWQERIALAPEAQGYQRWTLARLYLQQPVVPAGDRAKAEKIVAEQMADGGSLDDAMRALLGETFANQVAPKDPVAIWRKHAQTGDPESMFRFAELIEEEQPEEAYQWYFKAADKGYAPAELMAFLILEGQSSLEAAHHQRQYAYLSRAAESGYAPAQYRLGQFLDDLHPMDGKFAPADRKAAAAWFRKAAEQGHVEAMGTWGIALAMGKSVPEDLNGALVFLRKAALAGNGGAQECLALIYQNGTIGSEQKIPVDLREALRWKRMELAGNPTTIFELITLLAKLPDPTMGELTELRKLLEQRIADGDTDVRDQFDDVRRKLGEPVPEKPKPVVASAPAAPIAPAVPVTSVAPAAPVVPVASVPAPVAPAPVPVIDPKREAEKRYEARFATFQAQLNAARNAVGREAAARRLRVWIEQNVPYGERRAAGEWFLPRLTPALLRYPNEAFSLLVDFPQEIISDAMLKAADSALVSVIQAGARRVSEAFYADQRKNVELRRHWDQAHAGDGQAQLALGLAYLTLSDAMEKQWPYAVHWLTKANEQGVPGAYEPLAKLANAVNARMKAAAAAKDIDTLVDIHRHKAYSPLPDAHLSAYTAGAVLLDEGYGAAEDISLAEIYLRMAAEKGHVDAMLELGHLYVLHEAQPIDEKQALGWFQKAAAAGSHNAEAWVRVLTPQLDKVERGKLAQKIGGEQMQHAENKFDFGPAVPFSTFAARLGNPDAMAFLASQYLESDLPEAIKRYQQAAEAGSMKAASFLAGTYLEGRGLEKDAVQAREYQLMAAHGGERYDQNRAGMMLMLGQGGSIDLAGARVWLLKAAAQGQFEAMYHLGGLWFEHKYTREGTEAEAVGWWRKAAEGGERAAQFQLGLLHHFGRSGVAKDAALARKWITASARLRHPPAVLALKQIYGETLAESAPASAQAGATVVPAKTTLEEERTGAAAGNAEMMHRLGGRHETGDGVPMDYRVALDWYRKAAALGHEEARQAVAELEPTFKTGK